MNQLWVYELYLNLQANVAIFPGDNSCIEVVLRCMAAEGDGLGPHDLNDGGILATIMAAGFKGVLSYLWSSSYCKMCILDLTDLSETKLHAESVLNLHG